MTYERKRWSEADLLLFHVLRCWSFFDNSLSLILTLNPWRQGRETFRYSRSCQYFISWYFSCLLDNLIHTKRSLCPSSSSSYWSTMYFPSINFLLQVWLYFFVSFTVSPPVFFIDEMTWVSMWHSFFSAVISARRLLQEDYDKKQGMHLFSVMLGLRQQDIKLVTTAKNVREHIRQIMSCSLNLVFIQNQGWQLTVSDCVSGRKELRKILAAKHLKHVSHVFMFTRRGRIRDVIWGLF